MRVSANLAPINPERYATASADTHSPQDDLELWRDALRARFTAKGVTSQMKASDIFKWSAGSFEGFGFAVKDNTNNCVLYVLTGGNHTTTPDIDQWLGGSGANLRTHVKAVGNATGGTTAPPNGVVMIFNPDTTVAEADLDFDNTTELTYSGGDGTSLTTIDPSTLAGLAALRPTHAEMGVSFEEIYNNGAGIYAPFSVCYDDEEQVWAIMAEQGNDPGVRYLALMGGWIDPAGGDTNRQGTLCLQVTASISAAYNQDHAVVYASDAGGTERDYDLVPDEDFTASNFRISGGANDGKLDWKAIDITNGSGGSGTKGTTAVEYLVEATPFNDGRFIGYPIEMQDASHPVIKYTDSSLVMWEAGYPLPGSYRPGVVH